MRGYPKTLNSWEDVLFVTQHFPKSQWEADLHCLICDECTTMWVSDHELAEGEEGVTDATHKVIEMTDMGKVSRYQYVKVQNENAKIFRMRDCETAQDRQSAIADVEELLKQ